jgi:hypothetical protein
MDEEGFRQYLRENKRAGIDKNTAFVKEFEDYLRDQRDGKTLETVASNALILKSSSLQ